MKFRNFSRQPVYKTAGAASSVLCLLLSKLLLVISMVEMWEVCQKKNLSIYILPLLSTYYCYLYIFFSGTVRGFTQ